MRRAKRCLTIMLPILVLFLFMACTGDNEKKEKGKIEQFTDKTAEKMTDYIKTPLDRANEAAKKADKRNEVIYEAEEERAK